MQQSAAGEGLDLGKAKAGTRDHTESCRPSQGDREPRVAAEPLHKKADERRAREVTSATRVRKTRRERGPPPLCDTSDEEEPVRRPYSSNLKVAAKGNSATHPGDQPGRAGQQDTCTVGTKAKATARPQGGERPVPAPPQSQARGSDEDPVVYVASVCDGVAGIFCSCQLLH